MEYNKKSMLQKHPISSIYAVPFANGYKYVTSLLLECGETLKCYISNSEAEAISYISSSSTPSHFEVHHLEDGGWAYSFKDSEDRIQVDEVVQDQSLASTVREAFDAYMAIG